MAAPSTGSETRLQISRTFQAPRERVFRAWTEPEQLNQWHAPSDEYQVDAQVDLRVGGSYRVRMTHSGGNEHTAYGEFKEVSEPEKLVYTWSWEDGYVRDTLVTVEFREQGSTTEVVLTHDLMPNAEARNRHKQGWEGSLSRLEKLLAGCACINDAY